MTLFALALNQNAALRRQLEELGLQASDLEAQSSANTTGMCPLRLFLFGVAVRMIAVSRQGFTSALRAPVSQVLTAMRLRKQL